MAVEHLEHLDQFFAMLAANSFTINLGKCTFMVPEPEVLGHIINKAGSTPTPHTYRLHRVPTHSGREAAAALPGDGQLLPPFHARYCRSPGAAHHHPQRR
jgi:hypothetical protein